MSVFITGASSGIGEACARAFAGVGRDLVLVARRKEKLDKLASELKSASKQPIQIHTFEADVRDRASVKNLFDEHGDVLKSVDTLLNNAGLGLGRGPIQDGLEEDWDQMIDTNVKGLLYVTKAFLPQMIAAHGGHIVNMGSVAGYRVYPGGAVYCASKFAVRALTEGLRLDILGTGIRVTEIAPGMVETNFSKVRFKGDAEKADAVYKGMRPLTAVDIAEAILWCVQRPAHVNIQSIALYPTDQASPEHVTKRWGPPFG
jgi:3-hydroxy acid dehydrogenase/malonic semialdehyde reductase